jgi:hypothetical protein
MLSGSDPIPTNSPCTSISKLNGTPRDLIWTRDVWEGGFHEKNRGDHQAV